LGKEKIELYGNIIDVDHFKLISKDITIPKDRRLDFDIWYDRKKCNNCKSYLFKNGELGI